MTKKTMIILGFLICFMISIPTISAFDPQINEHTIRITELDDSFQVREKTTYLTSSDTNTSFYLFQIPDQESDLKIYVENNIISDFELNDNTYTINLTGFNFSANDITIELTYFIPSSTSVFTKSFTYNTSDVHVYLENIQLSSNKNQLKDTTLQVRLTTSTEEASIQFYTLVLIILLVIIIIVTAWYGFFKKKNGQPRKRNFESSEVLTTEKKLLLDVLKEIEKMHRNEKISDDSYHKLKNHYKQQTVEIMSTLEDIESK